MSDASADVAQLRNELQNMYAAYTALQQQVNAVAGAAAPRNERKAELPKIRTPSAFSGQMGFVVDDWISEMEQQFTYYGAKFPDDTARIAFAVTFLQQNALHWWKKEPPVASWDDFVKRLHARFRPVQAAMMARQKLGKLRMRENSSVNQYASEFHVTMTPISDMGEMDQVHHFVNGLKPYIASRVWEKHPTTLKDAIDHAGHLVAALQQLRVCGQRA
jgi:hypothetical protein